MQPISDHRDAPGYFIDYLCQREAVYAFKLNASRFDMGNINTYREADERLNKEPVSIKLYQAIIGGKGENP